MYMSDHIRVLPPTEFQRRVELDAYKPLTGVKVVDCADVRPLTPLSEIQRRAELGVFGQSPLPGRFLGAAVGLAVVDLMAACAERGPTAAEPLHDGHVTEALVDHSVALGRKAAQKSGVWLTIHSSEGNEGSPVGITDHHECAKPLGCALCNYCGAVLETAAHNPQALADANEMEALAGEPSSNGGFLAAAVHGAQVLSQVIGPNTFVRRGDVDYAIKHSPGEVHTPILAGTQGPLEAAMLTIDFAGIRAGALLLIQAGVPRYHHTIQLATRFNSGTSSPEMYSAAALLMASATRLVLSGEDTPDALAAEVVPANYWQLPR
jgi:hypothetical protein